MRPLTPAQLKRVEDRLDAAIHKATVAFDEEVSRLDVALYAAIDKRTLAFSRAFAACHRAVQKGRP
jgi:hypothetical protein